MKRNMVVSLIGRPNVGKSSIFNRLMRKQHKAMTFDMPGVTRDRHYGIAKIDPARESSEKDIILVDTGGFYPQRIEEKAHEHDKFFNIMTDHAHMAIEESDLVLFVVDVREGALPFDNMIADYIRTKRKPFWVLVNKYDSDNQEGDEIDFYSLGIDSDQLFPISASHGLGFENLTERIYSQIEKFEMDSASGPGLQKGVTPREEVAGKVAIVGAPNAGKSTLLNLLLGSDRALVSDVAGTTVDPIEGYFDLYFGSDVKFLEEKSVGYKQDHLLVQQYDDFRKNNPLVYQNMLDSFEMEEEAPAPHQVVYDESVGRGDSLEKNLEQAFADEEDEIEEAEDTGSLWRSVHLIDTAGIRRQSNIKGFIEEQSVYRSLRCITESDVVLFMVDATKGIGHQDRRLIDIALEKGKSIIVLLNKMDLVRKEIPDEKDRKEWMEDLRAKIPWLDFCDICPISAKHRKGIKNLKFLLKKTIVVRNRPIPTGELNRFVFDLIERHPIVVKNSGGKRFKVKYASMVKTAPPTFLLFSNRSQGIPDNYRRYLKNNLRGYFELDNAPIHLLFRTGKELGQKRD